jgi:hypothetical protein
MKIGPENQRKREREKKKRETYVFILDCKPLLLKETLRSLLMSLTFVVNTLIPNVRAKLVSLCFSQYQKWLVSMFASQNSLVVQY